MTKVPITVTDTEQSQTPKDEAEASSENTTSNPGQPDGVDPSSAQAAPDATSDATDAGGDPAEPGTDPGEAELSAARAERDKLHDQLMRTTADFENFRRRSRRELEEAKMRGKDDAVKELLPVFDNLERAVQASENATEVASVLEGVKMVLKLFEDTAQRMGLNRVPGVGNPFDPAVHEAIQQQETDEHAPGTIISEVAAGYMFGKRLLRAAMVVVAKPKAAPSAKADGADQGGDS